MNYVVVFCAAVLIILAVIYVRHYTCYPKDFKLLQVTCTDLTYDVVRQKYPVVVEDFTDACVENAFPLRKLVGTGSSGSPNTQHVIVHGGWVNLYHPDDDDYLKVELGSSSALLVPRKWRYEAAPESKVYMTAWNVPTTLAELWSKLQK